MSRMKHTQVDKVLDSIIPEKWSLLHPHDMHEGIILSILLCDTKHITPTHYLSLALVPIKRQQIIRQTLLAQLILSSSLCKGICFCVSVEGFITFEWKKHLCTYKSLGEAFLRPCVLMQPLGNTMLSAVDICYFNTAWYVLHSQFRLLLVQTAYVYIQTSCIKLSKSVYTNATSWKQLLALDMYAILMLLNMYCNLVFLYRIATIHVPILIGSYCSLAKFP
jgi:hypothetical protein